MFFSRAFSCVWSALKWLFSVLKSWLPEAPISFPTSGFEIIPSSRLTEEESNDDFYFGDYYPVKIGEVLQSQYQIIGKLGFGTTSTNWLARDLKWRRFVALKIFTRRENGQAEFERMNYIQTHGHKHDGCTIMRDALDLITLPRPGGDHDCLVQTPLGQSLHDYQVSLGTKPVNLASLKYMLQQLFWGLEYLHNHCRLVHTDIKLDNILQSIEDESILHEFVQDELEKPSHRKTTGERTVYDTRVFPNSEGIGKIKLCDFGSAVCGDRRRSHQAQPNYFRAPEVLLKAHWSYPVDIWSVGMIIWQLVEGEHLFLGEDPWYGGYTNYAHLAEIVGMLGPPPPGFLLKGAKSGQFFERNGKWRSWEVPVYPTSLEDSVTFFEGKEKMRFIRFLRGMLQWRPEDRKTAGELLRDPWLYS